jgi:hypothetical protein
MRFDCARRDARPDLLTQQLVRHRVVVLVDVDVVVEPDPAFLPFSEDVGLGRQRLERRPFQILEQSATACTEMARCASIDLRHELADGLVQCTEREELPVAAILRLDMPAADSLSTSRTLRMGNLGSGIPRSLWKGAKPCRFADHPTAPVIPVHKWSRSLQWVVAIRRNAWSSSIGMTGRDQSESLVVISPCAQGHWESVCGWQEVRNFGPPGADLSFGLRNSELSMGSPCLGPGEVFDLLLGSTDRIGRSHRERGRARDKRPWTRSSVLLKRPGSSSRTAIGLVYA